MPVSPTIALIFSILVCDVLFAERSFSASAPTIKGPLTRTVNNGYFTLRWDVPSTSTGANVSIERSTSLHFDTDFKQFSTGDAHQLFFSGLPNGTFYFRVRQQRVDGSFLYSQPLILKVEHFSLTYALILLGLGAVAFIGIVAVVFGGSLNGEKR